MTQEYVSLFTDLSHIEKHFSGSLTAGSKFLPDAKDSVTKRVEQELKAAFDNAHKGGQDAQRTVLTLQFDRAIGTDALVELRGIPKNKKHRLVRDSGTPIEATFTAVETNQKDIPHTSMVTVIAGPYGPTGKWGLYTMFPGTEAPPFPSDKQPDDIRISNTEFWNTHGFLATKDEIKSHPPAPPETRPAMAARSAPHKRAKL